MITTGVTIIAATSTMTSTIAIEATAFIDATGRLLFEFAEQRGKG